MIRESQQFGELCTMYGIHVDSDGTIRCMACCGAVMYRIPGEPIAWSINIGSITEYVVRHVKVVHRHEEEGTEAPKKGLLSRLLGYAWL